MLLEDLDQRDGGLLGVAVEGVGSTATRPQVRFHTLETLSDL